MTSRRLCSTVKKLNFAFPFPLHFIFLVQLVCQCCCYFSFLSSLAESGEEVGALDEFDAAVRAGLWVSDAMLSGSAFENLHDHPRFISIKERMAKNSPH